MKTLLITCFSLLFMTAAFATVPDDPGVDCVGESGFDLTGCSPVEADYLLDSEGNWPCDVRQDPFTITCIEGLGENFGPVLFGSICTETDVDYIPVMIPPFSSMTFNFFDGNDCQNLRVGNDVDWKEYDGTNCDEVGDIESWEEITLTIVNESACVKHTGLMARTIHAPGLPTRIWKVVASCEPLQEYECTEEVYLGDRELPVLDSRCVFACEGVPINVYAPIFNTADPNATPVVQIHPGCNPNEGSFCDVDCDPIDETIDVDLLEWIIIDGYWCTRIVTESCGCFCITLDGYLPVELNSFAAISGDRQVTLNWSTASETNNDHFEIERNGATVALIDAMNAATGHDYSWTDNGVQNGVSYDYSLIAVDMSGNRDMLATESAIPAFNSATVSEYELHQNYPNPFNPETSISFDLAEAGFVSLTVFNSLGQEVAQLASGTRETGRHNVSFDATGLTSGLYFYRLEAGDFSAIRKMILMK